MIHTRTSRLGIAWTLAMLAAGTTAAAQEGRPQPQPAPAQQDREQQAREQQVREQQAREQQAREQQAREQQAREAGRGQAGTQDEAEQRRIAERERRAIEQRREGAAGQAGAGNQRAVAQQVFNAERRHRGLMARMDRVEAIYRQQGNTERLRELEQLRRMQNQRYEQAMRGFREQLGPQGFTRVESMMRQGRGAPREAGARGAEVRGTQRPGESQVRQQEPVRTPPQRENAEQPPR